MKTPAIEGFVPAVVTPFNADGDIQYRDFTRIVEWLIALGARSICVAGDNGESWALTPDERHKLLDLAVETCGKRIPVILGASAPTAAIAGKYARMAVQGGADAILLMPQTYVLKASRKELLAHFSRVADAADIAIVAYNSPRRAGIALSVDDIEAICGVAPIVGIKESTREIQHLTNLIERLGKRIAVMTGPSNFLLTAAALGAKGFIATGPELLGPDAARIMQLGQGAPNDDYRRVHYALTALYEVLMQLGTWPAAFKTALNLIGQPAGFPREPVAPLEPAQLDLLKACMNRLGLLPQRARAA